jgi:serine/threonine protein kinase
MSMPAVPLLLTPLLLLLLLLLLTLHILAAQLEDLRNEIGMQCLSKHVNIVNLREAYVTRSEVVIVMDCMEGGSLTDTLGPEVDFRETHIAYVCKQMLMALAFMHSQFRLHRDIKSDNVLVSSSSSAY